MAIDLSAYRASEREQARIRDLFELVPEKGGNALDIGARDGFLSLLLAERFDHVVALDLEKPDITHPHIEPVKGDASRLAFENDSFDLVVCAEVLEHIPPYLLPDACREISRVARQVVVIGVPYKQDLRCGRSTCRACGWTNPAWGHVNSFDEARLRDYFGVLQPPRFSFVGENNYRTNAISVALMDFAGNPYGTYAQEEACVHCGVKLQPPAGRSSLQKGASRLAFMLNKFQRAFTRPGANWMHARFEKSSPETTEQISKRALSQAPARHGKYSDAD